MRRFALFALAAAGCEPPSAEEVVAHVWEDFDARYATFGVRGVDWDAAHDEALAQLAATDGSDDALLDVLHGLLGRLDDDHVRLFVPDRTQTLWSAGGLSGRVMDDFDPEVTYALLDEVTSTPEAAWGTADGGRLGYLHVVRMDPAARRAGEAYLSSLSGVEGLLLDLRGNGGGSRPDAEDIVAHLFDETFVYGRSRFRTADGGFSEWEALDVDALGTHPTLPVAVLHNEFSVSATEEALMMLLDRPDTIRVGTASAGALSATSWRDAPNGWLYALPTEDVQTPDGTSFSAIGIPPDVEIAASPDDVGAGLDPVLGAALELLGGPEPGAR